MTTVQLGRERSVDPWNPGLTDSKVPRDQCISFIELSASNPFLTAPRPSTSPAFARKVPWLADVEHELRSYLELAPGWDSYSGEPAQETIVESAVLIVEVMAKCGFSRPDVCPQSSRGVLLEWQQADRALTVDIDGIEGFSFAYESPVEPESEGGIEDFVRLLSTDLQPL